MRPELPHEGDHEDTGLYAARLKAAAQVQGQVIRCGLAAGRGEDLDHPEQEGDLRHLGGNGFGEEPPRVAPHHPQLSRRAKRSAPETGVLACEPAEPRDARTGAMRTRQL